MDPLAEQTMEPYSYVGNNPIMYTDQEEVAHVIGKYDFLAVPVVEEKGGIL